MKAQKNRRRRGIGRRALVSHVCLALFVVVLTGGLSHLLITRYIRNARVAELMDKAQRIAETNRAMPNGKWMLKRSTVRTFEELTDAKVFYVSASTGRIRMSRYDSDGKKPEPSGLPEASAPPAATPPALGHGPKVIDLGESAAEDAEEDAAEEEPQWVEVMDAIDKSLAASILEGNSVSATRRFSFMQDIIMLAGVPIQDSKGTVQGGLILAQPVAELHTLYRGTYLVMALVTSGSVLLAMLLALEQSRTLVRPIQRITEAARRMAGGTSAERISPLPDNEIGDLGRALNSMSARLIDVIRNLSKERDKLEWVISGIGEGLIAVDRKGFIVHSKDRKSTRLNSSHNVASRMPSSA